MSPMDRKNFVGNGTKHGGTNGVHNQQQQRLTTRQQQPRPFRVLLTRRFVFLSFLSSLVVAFAVGRLARIVFVEQPQRALLAEHVRTVLEQQRLLLLGTSGSLGDANQISLSQGRALPPPKIRDDKEVPKTLYSSKNFDTAASASAKSILIEKKFSDASVTKSDHADSVTKKTKKKPWTQCVVDVEEYEGDEEDLPEECRVSRGTEAIYDDYESSDDADAVDHNELHLPAGQHLLVDIKEVDSSFLNDEQRLAQAMVDVVWESDLTLLSYHCHTLYPMGVTCVGVLLESHISFHTWPEQGVITLDLFTCGSGLLVPVIPLIERLFGVPQVPSYVGEEVEEPIMVWSHKLRGFRTEEVLRNEPLYSKKDLGTMLALMDLDYKKEVVSIKTKFQQVDVFDVIDPRIQNLLAYRKSLSDDGSYESNHPELYTPTRTVYLDGAMQSTSKGDEAYHEALVHPGMFAHPNPKRVAIIGGGEGATLREVLRHDTVEHVTMIEIDEGMVKTSREYLPAWSDCGDIVGSTQSCFEDFRTELLCEDAMAYFMNNFLGEAKEDKYDVIIMDALDPQDDIPFARTLYGSKEFFQSMYNSLTDDGIIIMQLGVSPQLSEVADELSGTNAPRAGLVRGLEDVGFESMHAYDEAHCGFLAPWVLLVACKDYSCRQQWYSSPAEVDVAIYNRMLRTYSGAPPLKHFDGATQQTYQTPSKGFEQIFCRRPNPAKECDYLRGYDPMVPNFPMQNFEVKESDKGFSELGVFSKVDIPEGSMIMQEKSIHAFNFYPSTFEAMSNLYSQQEEYAKDLGAIHRYIDVFGYENRLYGTSGHDASASIMSFVNHGCKGSHNINSDPTFNVTEATADPDNMPAAFYAKNYWQDVFNPVVNRHLSHLVGGYDVAVRDISKGEEILDNFLTSVGSEDNWEEMVLYLAEKCEEQEVTDA